MDRTYVEAGRVTTTHGVSGEVKIEVWLDSPQFFKTFKRVFIDGNEYKLISARPQKNFIIAKLEGYDDINAAMTLKNKTVSILRKDAKLPRGGFFIQDIIGARVINDDGTEVGLLEDVLETPANTIYVVHGQTEHLIPAVPEFILNTDVRNGVVTVHLIPGM